ncbi:hypothetical protein K438DRAFT_2018121 [Mycena galopus ATCC 62051]|nr:hypothetical protein K438DRAFT_2018121 [Mycena galopus ATCC 62051]
MSMNLILLFIIHFCVCFCADPIPVAPAPWSLGVSEGYIFVVAPPLSTAFLPPGWANPLEAPELRPGIILPDIGLILLVQYATTPVGPYDELIYIPGRWDYNLTDSGLRITQIYVSSNASVFNGRTNWNIPSDIHAQHLAVFDFETSVDGSTTVTVSPPDDISNPHFKATLTPATGQIPLQINSTLTGDYLSLIQPSIPASPTNPVEVGTDTWKQLLLDVTTDSLAASVISGALPGGRIGNGVGYPDIAPLLPIGAKISGTLVFSVATQVPTE